MKTGRKLTFLSAFLLSVVFGFLRAGHLYAGPGGGNAAIFISGLAGEDKYQVAMDTAYQLLTQILIENGFSGSDIFWFSPRHGKAADGTIRYAANRATIEREIEKLKIKDGVLDQVFVFIAGHASGYDEETMFHLPGPDVSYQTLMEWIDAIPAQRMVVVVAASQGHAWIQELGRPGRAIIAGNGLREHDFIPVTFLRLFPFSFFNAAKMAGENDASQDGVEVSLLDVFVETQKGVMNWYFANKLHPTELAWMDAAGDGRGEALVSATKTDDRPAEQVPHWDPSSDRNSPVKISDGQRLEFVLDRDSPNAVAAAAIRYRIPGRQP